MNRIRMLREERKLSLKRLQDDLLEKENIKVGRASLNNYERGEQSPKKEVWEHLANYFGVSVPYIMGISDEKKDTINLTEEKISQIIEHDSYKKIISEFSAFISKSIVNSYDEDVETIDIEKKLSMLITSINKLIDSRSFAEINLVFDILDIIFDKNGDFILFNIPVELEKIKKSKMDQDAELEALGYVLNSVFDIQNNLKSKFDNYLLEKIKTHEL